MALSLNQEACSSAYLVAATEEAWFEQQALGTELFAPGEWSADEIRTRYASWFRGYEQLDDPPIKRVPASVRVEPVARAVFEIQGTKWTIAASRVAVDSDSLIEWQPFLSSASDEVDGLAR